MIPQELLSMQKDGDNMGGYEWNGGQLWTLVIRSAFSIAIFSRVCLVK